MGPPLGEGPGTDELVNTLPLLHLYLWRLKENGKPEKAARIAAARKLLLIHVVYRSGQPYRIWPHKPAPTTQSCYHKTQW